MISLLGLLLATLGTPMMCEKRQERSKYNRWKDSNEKRMKANLDTERMEK